MLHCIYLPTQRSCEQKKDYKTRFFFFFLIFCCCCLCIHSSFQCHYEDWKTSFSLPHYTDEEVGPWEITTIDLTNIPHLDSNSTKFFFQFILLYCVCAHQAASCISVSPMKTLPPDQVRYLSLYFCSRYMA